MDAAEAAVSRFRRDPDIGASFNGFDVVERWHCTTTISVYSNMEAADLAATRIHPVPGFAEPRHRFEIVEDELDMDHWTEGFISWKEAAE